MADPIVDQFVGRTTELRLVRQLLHVVTGGVGRLLLISGEPGIGKSRFASEACAMAREAEFDVRWVDCLEGAIAPPLWPWQKLLGTEASVLPAVQPGQDLFQAYTSMLAPVAEQSSRTPIMLCIDDLQWADPDSLRMLRLAAQVLVQERVLIVAVYCNAYQETSSAFGATVGSCVKDPTSVSVHLGPLDRRAMEKYCRSRGVRKPEQIELAVRLTEGVPLYLKALSQRDGEHRIIEHIARTNDGAIETPVELKNVLDYRLSRLSAKSTEVLATAALLGQEADVVVLSAVSGWSADAILDALAEAERIALVQVFVSDSGETVVRFAHVLVRYAVVATIPVASRFCRHARIYDELTRYYGESAPQHAQALLYHARRSGGVVPPVQIAKLARAAGDAALAAVAPEEASNLFRFGLRQLESYGASAKETAAALHEGLACALYSLCPNEGDIEENYHYRQAMRLYCDLRDRTSIRRLLPLVARQPPYRGAEPETAGRLLELFPDGDADRCLALFYAAIARYSETRVPEHARMILQPLVSGPEYPPDIRARAYEFLAETYHWDGQYAEQATHLHLAKVEARAAGEHWLVQRYEREQAETDHRLGRSGAPGMPRQSIRSDTRDTSPEATFEPQLERLTRARAELGRLVHHCRWTEVADALRFLGFPTPAVDTSKVRTHVTTAYAFTGRFVEAREVLDRLFASRRHLAAYWRPIASFDYWLATGDLRYSERIIDECDQILASPPYYRRAGGMARSFGALYLAVQSRFGQALELFDPEDAPLVDSGNLVLGIAARYLNQVNLSVELLVPDAGPEEQPHLIGFRRLHYALSLIARNASGDRERAHAVLSDALSDAERYSIPPLAAQVQSAMESLEMQPASPASGVARALLTRREQEVLRLVASGRSDKEIGGELSIAVKTVSNYVSALLRKSHCGNRTELARWALDHGLAE